LKSGTPVGGLLLGVAGWMKYASGRDWQGRALDVCDPFGAETVRIGAAAATAAAGMIDRFLDIGAIFGTDLRSNPDVKRRLAAYLSALAEKPAIEVVADHMAGRFERG
jgi:fructuronate reductase